MKFVCNNCGFAADIPEQRSSCPMCGSSNVSSAAEVHTEPSEKEDENAKSQNLRASVGPTQRVTLTEGLDGGDKPEVPSKKEVAKPVKKSKAPFVVAVLLILAAAAAAAAFFFFFK